MDFNRGRAWVGLVALAAVLGVAAPPARAQMDLLVTSHSRGAVLLYDGGTGEFRGNFVPDGSGGLTLAGNVTVGPDGDVYVASGASPGAVRRYDGTTGEFEGVFSPGWPAGINGMLFGPDGDLYGAVFDVDRVCRANGSTGVLIDCNIGAGSPLDGATGIAFGPDGNLYVGSYNTNQVLRFDGTTGAYLGAFGPTLSGGGVGGMTFGPDGSLYVALVLGDDIVRLEYPSGASTGSFIPPGDPRPDGPFSPRFGPDGNLYVLARDTPTPNLLRYDGATGAFIDVFASSELPPPIATPIGPVQGLPGGGLERPSGIAFLPEPPGPFPPDPPGVLKYFGIRYAEPPVRWQRPVRRAVSATTIDATAFGPACAQGRSGQPVTGSEDCLTLNIWRPESPTVPTPLPVLVDIHGGSLSGGSASGAATDASDLALRQNLVVVKIQYRLGVFGFFGLPELAAEDPNGSTGNYGFLDQLEALGWVQDNIAAFGGDPTRVTIAGESAGGWSVCALMASPLSNGLFQGGIVQSGRCQNALPLTAGSSVIADPAVGTSVYARGQAVTAAAGCGAAPDKLACLRDETTTAELVQALAGQPPGLDGAPPASPALDGYVLTEQPIAMLRQGAADGRPLVIGSNANEMTSWTVGIDPLLQSQFIYDFYVRQRLGNTRTNVLLPLYPAASYPPLYGSSYAEAFRALFEDTSLVCPTLAVANAITQGGSPAWVYHLSYAPTYPPSSPDAPLRTFHGLDLYYLFRSPPPYGIAPNDALSDSMQEAWGSFARTGVPSTVPAWPVFAPSSPGDLASVSVLNFDVPNFTSTGTAFRSGRCAALVPVRDLLDPDEDISVYDVDNCPTTANTSQLNFDADGPGDACDRCETIANAGADTDMDGVDDACDTCTSHANPPIAGAPTANRTFVSHQRDDDADGRGNRCDFDYNNAGATLTAADFNDMKFSLLPSPGLMTQNTCGGTATEGGSGATQPCGEFDHDGSGATVTNTDFNLSKAAVAGGGVINTNFPKCAACTQGTGWSNVLGPGARTGRPVCQSAVAGACVYAP